jgi:hypothetical protein
LFPLILYQNFHPLSHHHSFAFDNNQDFHADTSAFSQGTDSQSTLPQPQAIRGSPHCSGQRLDHPGQGPLDDPQLDARSSKRWRSENKV